MAQPANKRTPLKIDAFWEKPTPGPPLRWEKKRVQYKLALLAMQYIIPDTLLVPKPEKVDLPLEPIYEKVIVGSSAQSERERNARNAQQKINWKNKCQRLIEVSIMCGDKAWLLADRKTFSVLYLSIGVEKRTDPDLQIPANNDRCTLYCGILEKCERRFHPNLKHHF